MTHCLPGAKVSDRTLPHVQEVIAHVGTNDTSLKESEILKHDFVPPLNIFKDCEKRLLVLVPSSLLTEAWGILAGCLASKTGYSQPAFHRTLCLLAILTCSGGDSPF